MENITTLKQEYEDSDHQNYDPIIKKEEYIFPKLEDTTHQSYPVLCFNDQMTLPWSANCVRFNSLPLFWPGYFTDLTLVEPKYLAKPFKIIKTQRYENSLSSMVDYCGSNNQAHQNDKFVTVKIEQPINNKNQTQPNFCKNYVGLLCSGFARTVLTTKYGSQIASFIKETLTKRKMKFPSLRNQDDARLVDSFRNHIHKLMCGKKIRKANKERDFKIRNTRDLQKLWKILDKDSELTRIKKEVLREVMEYFFESDYYAEWLSNGMMSPQNRNFFISNKVEIQYKVLYPGVYKPKFNRNLD